MSIHVLVIEPRTVARFPFQATDHAKLGHAPTRHMVAAFLQLDHSRAVEAFLPALLFCRIDELLSRRVLRTITRAVRLVVADGTDLSPAALAFAHLPTMLDVDMARLDPLAAILANAVYSVLGFVFEEFTIPVLLKFLIEQLVNML